MRLPVPLQRLPRRRSEHAHGQARGLQETTLPSYGSGAHVDPKVWTDSDGFSPGQPALFHLPGATVTGFPTQDTIESSLGPDSPTVLIDAETGERVAHFSERDESILDEEPEDRALIIRPVVRLRTTLATSSR